MQEMIEKALPFIRGSSNESKVYVGCDSIRVKKNDIWYARFATVIVLHIDGLHGCKLFHKVTLERDFGNREMRLMREAGLAFELATALIPLIGNKHLEVHLDFNPDPKFASNKVVSEATGWCKGLGLNYKIKPDAPVASYAADHACRYLA
jgi:predicted RNase H-related nuclease YkuK (DUF458 family)